MSKLKDLVGKGVRLIVANVPEGRASPERDIPADAFAEANPADLTGTDVPADIADFAAVYRAAGIDLPPHGYGVDKAAEMLASKRLETLGREVKAAAVLAALEAAGVSVRDVIQDAVLRDRAMDAFEAAKGRELQELREKTEARIKATKEEIDAFLREKNAEMEGLKKAVEAADQAFLQLQARKRREEERLHDVVAHFVEGAENPITTSPGTAPPPPKTGPA